MKTLFPTHFRTLAPLALACLLLAACGDRREPVKPTVGAATQPAAPANR